MSRYTTANNKSKMIFTNSDLSGACMTSSSDAVTPCDVEMMPLIGTHEQAGGVVPEVGAVEDVTYDDDDVQEVPDVIDVMTAGSPLLSDGATVVPLTVVGVEAAEDLVAIDLIAVSTVTTTADLCTPSAVAAVDGAMTTSSIAPVATSTYSSSSSSSFPYLPTTISDEPLDLSTPTRERISLAIELAVSQNSCLSSQAGGGGCYLDGEASPVDAGLAEALLKAATTGTMTPIIKEELKCSIQTKRLAEGKDEMMVEFSEPEQTTLTPEEETRRVERRERNRLAAQRCRKRRTDKADVLEEESHMWEKKNKLLNDDILELERERAELEAMLRAHDTDASRRGTCKERLSTSSLEEDDVISVNS